MSRQIQDFENEKFAKKKFILDAKPETEIFNGL